MTTENQNTPGMYSDEELIKNWPGFKNGYAAVNGITLHYVEGGSGMPLICLPGWPQTWYSFGAVAPQLAEKYRVIVADLRGMGSSSKPESGYDKKTMAEDIYRLMQHLELEKACILGHDIGGMVAMSFAYNYPEAVQKLIVMDGAHPSEGMMQMPLLPQPGTFGNKMDSNAPYAWWMGFNQVKGLPEKLLEGRFNYLLDYLFAYVMIDETKMPAFDRALYTHIYNNPENIRAANAWYQTFGQDIEDAKQYKPLTMSLLGIGSNVSYNYMKIALPYAAANCRVEGILNSGHYMNEEKPDEVIRLVTAFLENE